MGAMVTESLREIFIEVFTVMVKQVAMNMATRVVKIFDYYADKIVNGIIVDLTTGEIIAEKTIDELLLEGNHTEAIRRIQGNENRTREPVRMWSFEELQSLGIPKRRGNNFTKHQFYGSKHEQFA